MIYVGSGRFGDYCKAQDILTETPVTFVWGRRFRNVTIRDLKSIKGKGVLYLDTVDLGSPVISAAHRLRFLLWPYRVEKALTYFLIRIVSSHVIRVHVPAIVDSPAWQNLRLDGAADTVKVPGFTYESLFHLVTFLGRAEKKAKRISSKELFRIARDQNINIQFIEVARDNFSAQLVRSIPCEELH